MTDKVFICMICGDEAVNKETCLACDAVLDCEWDDEEDYECL